MADNDYRESLSLDVSNFVGGLQAAQVALGTFAGTIAERVVESLKHMAEELVATAREVGQAAQELENLSAASGVSEANLTTLESVAGVVGIGIDGLSSVMRILSMRMQEADQGNMQMQARLKLLGVTVRDPYQALLQISETMTKYAADGARIAVSNEVMGRGFSRLLPALKGGLDAFKEGADRAALLGTAFDDLTEHKLLAMNRAWNTAGQAAEGFWKQLVGTLAPAIEQVLKAFTELTTIVTEFFLLSDSDLMEAHWIRFGALLKSIASDVTGLMGGKAFSAEGLAEMNASITAIEKERDARLAEIHKRNITKPGPEADKPSIGVPNDKAQADAIKMAEENLKVKIAEIDTDAKTQKAILDTHKSFLKQQVEARQMTAVEEAAVELKAANDETRLGQTVATTEAGIERLAAVSKLEALQKYHNQRLALGFGGSDTEAMAKSTSLKKQEFELQYSAAVIKVTGEINVADEKMNKARLESAQKFDKEREAVEKVTGDSTVARTKGNYEIENEIMKRAMEDDVKMAEARLAVYENDFGSFRDIAIAKMNILKTQMDLDVHNAQMVGASKQAIAAIKTKSMALQVTAEREAQGDFVDGWHTALQKYVNDQTTMFGMGVDMVRQMASQMESSFQTLFLDGMNNKITTLKQLFASFGDFVKQVIAQIMAKMAIALVMKEALAAWGGGGSSGLLSAGGGGSELFANGGGLVQKFALGGPVMSNGDSVPALLTPGEFVVSRQGVDALNRVNQGQSLGGGGSGDVTVNIVGSGQDQKPTVNIQRQFGAMVVDVIWTNVRQNGSLRQLFAH